MKLLKHLPYTGSNVFILNDKVMKRIQNGED
jgi:hypothetical protein